MDERGVGRSVDALLAAGYGEGQLKRLLQQHMNENGEQFRHSDCVHAANVSKLVWSMPGGGSLSVGMWPARRSLSVVLWLVACSPTAAVLHYGPLLSLPRWGPQDCGLHRGHGSLRRGCDDDQQQRPRGDEGAASSVSVDRG